jgi:ribonuclease HI
MDGASRHTQNIASTTYLMRWSVQQLGPTTNNMVEYHAVIGLLTQASSLGISRIIVNLDSQLVVYQLNQIYAIRQSYPATSPPTSSPS